MKSDKQYFKIKNNKFCSFRKTLIIAEIGSNHNNKFENIKKMISIAKEAGCDAVKFQLFKAQNLVPVNSNAFNVLKKIELPEFKILNPNPNPQPQKVNLMSLKHLKF